MSGPGITEREWHALYIQMERRLYNLAYRYVWDRQDAQDTVHDALLELWARRQRIRADTADRYLWIAVLNLSRKRRRWRRTKSFLYGEVALLVLPVVDSAEPQAAAAQEHQLLHEAIDRLPEKLRSVLLLTEFAEMSHQSIAELLAIPAGTVASRRHLALQRLHSQLKVAKNEHS
jgi:RNA polymerase sigma-70 factor (ECF subfamily)